MAQKWSLQGNWINSCSCEVGCPCLFYSDPTKGYCDGMDAFHIVKGSYGKVKLDGLNAVMVGKSPGNFWKGNWTAALYLDDRANKEQREALETVMGGKVGGAPAMLASLIGTMKGLKYVPIKVDAKKHSVEVPNILEYQIESTEGGNKKKPIVVSNHPLEPAVGPINEGKGSKAWFKDYGMSFDNKGKDGNWADFKFSGP